MCTWMPSKATAGERSRRSMSAGASPIGTPNLDSAWPVEMKAWVSPATSGLTRSSARTGGSGASASSRSTSSLLSTITQPTPTSSACRSSASDLALPCR